MTELTSKQYICIVVFIFFTSKLVTMPSLVFSTANNDAIISVLINTLIELITISLCTLVIIRNPKTTLFDILKRKIGILAYLVIGLLIIFLLARILYCFQELYSFFLETLYDDLNPYIFIFSALCVCLFFAFKKATVIGRTCEILLWFILIGTVLSLLSNLEYASFTQNMPYLENGLSPTLSGCKDAMFLFGTPTCLLLLTGKVKPNHHLFKNTLVVTSICVVFCVVACFIFYATFGNSMQYVLFSLSEYSQYDPYILELQRLIWMSAVIDISKLFCSTCCLMYLLKAALVDSFRFKSLVLPLLTMSAVIIIVGILTRFDTIFWFDLTKSYLSYFTIALILICQIICLVLSIRRKDDKTIN
ncbi:MAG: GerAB/ArcD/ProY family transporter [Clostridia bacterium]|nr:GerAB/ArcD/ProY family transporter [Clostridia bacterium]